MAYNRFMRDPRLRGIFQRQLQSRRPQAQPPVRQTPQVSTPNYDPGPEPIGAPAPTPDPYQAGPVRQPPKPPTQLPPIQPGQPLHSQIPGVRWSGWNLNKTMKQPPVQTGGFKPIPTSPVRQMPGTDRASPAQQAINSSQGTNRTGAWNRNASWLNRFLGRGKAYQNVHRNLSNEQAGLGQPKKITNSAPYGYYTKGRGV